LQSTEPLGEWKLVPKIERFKTDKVICLTYSNSFAKGTKAALNNQEGGGGVLHFCSKQC